MSLKSRIDQDLKAAMLGGDKPLVSVLRGIKSAILYEELAKNQREVGMDDGQLIILLQKELKKRVEAADLFARGGAKEREENERYEAGVITAYLPQQITDEELTEIIKEIIGQLGNGANMGSVIGAVKAKVGASADGSRIAQKVKEELA